MKRIFVFFVILAALLSACGSSNTSGDTLPAPDFTLPNSLGGDVSLQDYQGKNVLLFFHMAVGWPPCLEQVVDLQNSDEFKAMGVEIVSIARDSANEQSAAAQQLGISVPMLVDTNGQVTIDYDVMKYAMENGEPSHTFVLVDANGNIIWLKDYGAPDNPNRTMYVDIEELYREVNSALMAGN